MELRWRKSTRSADNENTNCVEVAMLEQGTAIRDSKNPGPTLTIPQNAWSALVSTFAG